MLMYRRWVLGREPPGMQECIIQKGVWNGGRATHTIRQRVCELVSRQRTQSGKGCENWQADSAHNQAKGV